MVFIVMIGNIIITTLYNGNQLMSYSTGAPAGYTGSPFDAKTCKSCHAGPAAIVQAGWITSNVSDSGYVPGTTYTITATITRPGHSKFGFEASPQSNTGALLGTLVKTSTQTQIVGTKYITHTSTGTTGSGGIKTWTFDWTAPAQGTGSVTFYGAFNASNSNGSSSGDTTFTSTLTLLENTTVGLNSISAVKQNMVIFPNPSSEYIKIQLNVSEPNLVEIKLYNIEGKLIDILLSEQLSSGPVSYDFTTDKYTPGIYFMKVTTGDDVLFEKVIIK